MISTAEEIIENVRLLPEFERVKFFKLVETEEVQAIKNGDKSDIKDEKFKLALKWIDEHRQEFDGQFVLLDGDNLIAHGKEAKPLYSEARSKGLEIPFVKRINAKELPFGGW